MRKLKLISLMLALALVISLLPINSASAATQVPQMYKTLRLFIGGDVTGTYKDAAYAKIWWKGDYKVEFLSDNENVAKVSKKGYVTAVSVGTANVTAVFTCPGEKTIVKTCKVTVKKNAVDAGISETCANALEDGLVAGQKYQVRAYRTDADGNTVWKGTEQITSKMRFTSSDKEVFTVTKTGGNITAVAPGTATLKVWAVQGEKPNRDENGKVIEYLPVTPYAEYTVNVVGIEEIEQSANNTFKVTFSNEDVAKAAIENGVIKVTIADEKTGSPIDVEIKSGSVDGNVATIELAGLKNNTDYLVSYMSHVVSITADKAAVVEKVEQFSNNSFEITFVSRELASSYMSNTTVTVSMKDGVNDRYIPVEVTNVAVVGESVRVTVKELTENKDYVIHIGELAIDVSVGEMKPGITDAVLKSVTEIELTVDGMLADSLKDLKIMNEAGGDICTLFKEPSLSEDRTKAVLTKYIDFVNGEKVIFELGESKYEYTVKLGDPKSVVITGPIKVVNGEATEIEFAVVDENGIDLGIKNGISFELSDYATSFVDGDNAITIYQTGKSVSVTAVYDTGKYDSEWKPITMRSNTFTIACVDEPTATVSSVRYLVADEYDSSKLSLEPATMFEDSMGKRVFAEVTLSNNKTASSITEEGFVFEALTPTVILVDSSTGYLAPVASGVGKVLVKYVSGATALHTSVVTINVRPAPVEKSITIMDNGQAISNSAKINDFAESKVVGRDQYGNVVVIRLTGMEAVSFPSGVTADEAARRLTLGKDSVVFVGAGAKAGSYTYKITSANDNNAVLRVVVREPNQTVSSYKIQASSAAVEVDPGKVDSVDFAQVTIRVLALDSHGIAIEYVDCDEVSGLTVKSNKVTVSPILLSDVLEDELKAATAVAKSVTEAKDATDKAVADAEKGKTEAEAKVAKAEEALEKAAAEEREEKEAALAEAEEELEEAEDVLKEAKRAAEAADKALKDATDRLSDARNAASETPFIESTWVLNFAEADAFGVRTPDDAAGSSLIVPVAGGYNGYTITAGSFAVTAKVSSKTVVPMVIKVSMDTKAPSYKVKTAAVTADAGTYRDEIMDQFVIADGHEEFQGITPYLGEVVTPITDESKAGASYVLVKSINVYELVGKVYVLHTINVNRYFYVTLN